MRRVVTVGQLVEIQRKAMRQRVWCKALNRTEQAIVSLTIQCVDRIRSSKLIEIVKAIVIKLNAAMKGRVKKAIEFVGYSLSQKLSRVAEDWGNTSARRWALDPGFKRFLAIMYLNTQVFGTIRRRKACIQVRAMEFSR